ncbi:unnamed protein product [Adineta steineri]|uniref:HTH OST-type domain-containing protein n=1 Tax=Adineta steineri TaxID=433720 RepID=A0A818SLC9_9BILA|nr:unnamed protein product [Adineta steineri]CAF1221947.1 unnamed protein product [Adineta steineri]CAF1228100.1 unnamed protein product [Adineta steineri]CAF3674537.1 unnamed protein product [Adineta steineri]CAF3778899.1 unnamed protein product [Adineta steineri]
MSVSSSSSPTHLMPIDPRVYCETMNELHSYITSSKRGYLTQAELFRYYRQRHENAEIPYRLLGYRSLLDLLSSDQRLFAIDLRREPAYVYSAVKLRQQKREQRQGSTSFSRQHHSTNTLDDQHVTSHDYIFFDHHVSLNEQEQNISSVNENENEPSNDDVQNERPLTPNNSNRFNTNAWQTPQSNEQIPLMEKQINSEESNEEAIQFVSNPFLPLPTVRLPLEKLKDSSFVKCENQYQPVQRRIISQDDDDNDENNKRSLTRDKTLLKVSSGRLNRSISTSTSTTTLSKTYSFHIIDAYIFLFTVVISFVFLGIYLLKIC